MRQPIRCKKQSPVGYPDGSGRARVAHNGNYASVTDLSGLAGRANR
ncbi:hypothetical protein [Tatumella sp. JGM118]|nr:hypothetical protein [Tatumella sp. JGM118]MBS0908156.1 hypothetical protein [Tatumella sp. JGM118]